MNIGTLLPRHAYYRPNHPALLFGDKTLTFSELNTEVNKLANALLQLGVAKGDKVATVLPNGLPLMCAYWAAAKTGIVIVPCSTLLQGNGLVNLLRDADVACVIADVSFGESLCAAQEQLPELTVDRIITVGHIDSSALRGRDYANWQASAPSTEPPDAGIVDSDPYNIMYSSGTTGAPKGIVHTHYVRAMYCSLFASAWRMTPESVVLHAGAIVFNGAMLDLMPWMFVGCTYILHERFDADAVIAAIQQEKVTHIIMVPSQIIALLNSSKFDAESLASLQMIQNLGAPLHTTHKQRLNTYLPGRFYELYGLTEGFVTILDKQDALRKLGSVGVPPPFFEMRILDEHGRDCAAGEIGEICGRGPILMTGYYKRPELTAAAIYDGWLHSGDLGYVDEEGYLYLVDRMKDMIISGGVNVYPKDIEEVISQHPAVKEVAVFGAVDAKWGETPVAAIITKPGKQIDARTLIEWTNSRVNAKYQRIHDVLQLDDFPRNIAGKVLKRELRKRCDATAE